MRASIIVLAAAGLLSATPVLAVAAPSLQAAATQPVGTTARNAVQQRADRANHDRWERNDSRPEAATAEEEDQDSSDVGGSVGQRVPRSNPRELNGNLHLGDW